MHDYSENELFDGEREAIIDGMTLAEIYDLTNEIEAYERKYPDKSEDEVIKLVMSKRWYYVPKMPDFPSWRDWFVIMTMNRVRESLKYYKYKVTDDELKHVEILIYKTMDEFPAWKSKLGYYRQRIGFRKFEP